MLRLSLGALDVTLYFGRPVQGAAMKNTKIAIEG